MWQSWWIQYIALRPALHDGKVRTWLTVSRQTSGLYLVVIQKLQKVLQCENEIM